MNRKYALKAISLLWVGSLLGAGLGFLTQIILARYLGPGRYGAFSASLTTVTLLAPLAGFGLQAFWLKAFGQEGWAARRWLPASFKFVASSTLLVGALLIMWAEFGPHGIDTRYSLVILTSYLAGQAILELVSTKLQLEEKYLTLSAWQLTPHLGRLAIIVGFVMVMDESISTVDVSIIYSIVAIVFTLLGIYPLWQMTNRRFTLKEHGPFSGHLNKATVYPSVYETCSQAWPFGLAVIFHLLYYQSNIVLLQKLDGDNAAGIYNVAFIVMTGVYLLPSVIYQKFMLAKLHRWARHDKDMFYKAYRQGNLAMVVLGVLAAICLWGIVPYMVPLLFGDAYKTAVNLLLILSFCAPLRFVAMSVGAVLVTQEHMRKKVKYMGVVAVVNIILNLVLIPKFSYYGAAIATLISEALLLILYRYAASAFVFKQRQIVIIR